jgi:CubicO group peptidase (beta-lactamase class C family)
MSAHRPSRLPRRSLDEAFDRAASQVADGTVPFVIVGIASAEGVIRLEAFGPLDGPRLGVRAVCLLASVTKPIVTTAILREVEAGRLDLAEPLSATVRGLDRPDVTPFSAWHVLTHTSGLGDIDVEALLLEGGDRAELLRRAAAVPQATPPGSTFRYASTPLDLLAEAVEQRLARPFADVVHANVLEPLGMTRTTFHPPTGAGVTLAPVRVDLARLAGVPAATLLAAYTQLRLAGGGLWSTADDVLRFGRAILRRGELDGVRVLSPAFVDLMTREVTVNGLGAATDVLHAEHYAVGWAKPGIASPASPASFGHGGATGTRLWVDPAHDLVFLYLSGVWEMAHPPINAVHDAVYAALP